MATHTLEVKENEHGEPCIIFPPKLLNDLNWSEGDTLRFTEHGDSIEVRKVNLSTVDLDFTDEELFRYMKMAHERGQTLDEFVEDAIVGVIEEVKELENIQNFCDRPKNADESVSEN